MQLEGQEICLACVYLLWYVFNASSCLRRYLAFRRDTHLLLSQQPQDIYRKISIGTGRWNVVPGRNVGEAFGIRVNQFIRYMAFSVNSVHSIYGEIYDKSN